MRSIGKATILFFAWGLFCLFPLATGARYQPSSTYPQGSLLVEVVGSGQINLNGRRIGMLDEPAMLGMGLQQALKFHKGRAVVELRFLGEGTWADFVGLIVVIEQTAADEIQIKGAANSESIVVLRKRPNPPRTDVAAIKPNPLTLIVDIDADGDLYLNDEAGGSISDPTQELSLLKRILTERERDHVFKPGLETRNDLPIERRIEKTVFIRASRSLTAVHVLKIITLVKSTGANPVGIQLDDLPP